jgi:hypothetical protein
MRSAGREFLRLCGVAIVVGGLAAALTLLFIPLSAQRDKQQGAVVGFCGPGRTSDNAVQVRLDPGIVNTGGSPGQAGSAAQQQQLQQFCTHEADGQLIESAVIAVLALLIGLPMITARGRQDDTPLSPGAVPPSLSSSGASGSTVWK